MRSKKAFYNLIVAIVLQFITILLGFIIVPIRISTYGSEINGLIASITQFLTYFKLVEAGLGAASMQALYSPLNEKNNDKIGAILSATKEFYNRAGFLFLSLVCIFSMIFPFIIKDNDVPNFVVTFLVLIIAGSSIIELFIYAKYRILLNADQKGYVVNIIQISRSILNTGVTIILMYSGQSILVVTFWSTITYFLASLIIIYYFRKNYPGINMKIKPDHFAINKRWDAFIHQIAGLIIFNTPMIVITIFLGLKDASVYSVYMLIFGAIGNLIGAFSSGLLAAFGQVIAIGDKLAFRKTFNSFECLFDMIVTTIYTSTLILIIPFIEIYTSGIKDANYVDTLLAILFVVAGLLNNFRVPYATIVTAAGHFKETRWRAILEAGINLIASLVFVVFLGIYGVLIGLICSCVYRTIDFIIYGNLLVLEKSPKSSFKRIIINILIGSTIVLTFVLIKPIGDLNWITWFIQAIIVTSISFLIILLGNFIFDRPAILDLSIRLRILLTNLLKRERGV